MNDLSDSPQPVAAPIPSPAKPWWRSRTLWVNGVAAGLVALEANTHILAPLLPVPLYATVAGALPVINAILRVVTTQPVALKTTGSGGEA